MRDNPELTLRAGIAQFCEKNAALLAERNVSPEAKAFFRFHDTAHVVSDCDTSVFGEGVVKMFTIFGTTLGFRGHLAGYSEADAADLFRQYSMGQLIRDGGRLILVAPKVITRARRMYKPWPWSDHSQYLDRPLGAIRREFNIKVLVE